MKDRSKFVIIHESQNRDVRVGNKAARQVFHRLNLTWKIDGCDMKKFPVGIFLILYSQRMNGKDDLIPFPSYKGVLEWIRHVNREMAYDVQTTNIHSNTIRFVEVPRPSAYLQSRVGSKSTDMSVLAPLIVSTLGDDVCPDCNEIPEKFRNNLCAGMWSCMWTSRYSF